MTTFNDRNHTVVPKHETNISSVIVAHKDTSAYRIDRTWWLQRAEHRCSHNQSIPKKIQNAYHSGNSFQKA